MTRLPRAVDVFVDATFFWRCSSIIGEKRFTFPSIALEAFSLELHLKCLHRISHRRIRKYSHEIISSFNGLTPANQRKIRRQFAKDVGMRADCRQQMQDGFSLAFDDVLKRAEGLFEQARYSYEGKLLKKRRNKKGINHGISPLIRTIHDLILAKRPQWKTLSQLVKL